MFKSGQLKADVGDDEDDNKLFVSIFSKLKMMN